MKTGKNKIPQIFASIYFALYFIGFIIPFFTGEMSLSKLQDISVLLAFLLFLGGFVTLWFNEKAGGYLLQSWVILIWTLGLFYWPDAGMVILLSVPVLVIGVFLNRKAYLDSAESLQGSQLDWKYTLRLFLKNYVLLYLLVVVSDLTRDNNFDYFGLPFVLFPVLLALFIAGVALSYRKESLAGLIFIVWYIVLIIGSVNYFELYNTGPWFVFGISVLIHGIFYLIYHFRFQSKKIVG